MRLPSKRRTFWLLMAASAVAVSLPGHVLLPLRGAFDSALGPLSDWLHAGSQSVREHAGQWLAVRGTADPKLQAERDAFFVEIVRLRQNNKVLTTQLAEATGLRAELRLRGRLIPATVLARDSVSLREAALIDMGRNVQLKAKQWAMAGVRGFVDRGQDASLAEGLWTVQPLSNEQAAETFNRSVLIGRVEVVGQVTSRIKLLSDWDSRIGAQVYDQHADRPGPLCSIRGQGPGQPLLAEGVEPARSHAGQRDHDEPPAKPGQLVLTSPGEPNVSGQLLIGVVQKVTRVAPGVTYELQVAPAIDYSYASRVFIIDAAPPEPGREGR